MQSLPVRLIFGGIIYFSAHNYNALKSLYKRTETKLESADNVVGDKFTGFLLNVTEHCFIYYAIDGEEMEFLIQKTEVV